MICILNWTSNWLQVDENVSFPIWEFVIIAIIGILGFAGLVGFWTYVIGNEEDRNARPGILNIQYIQHEENYAPAESAKSKQCVVHLMDSGVAKTSKRRDSEPETSHDLEGIDGDWQVNTSAKSSELLFSIEKQMRHVRLQREVSQMTSLIQASASKPDGNILGETIV